MAAKKQKSPNLAETVVPSENCEKGNPLSSLRISVQDGYQSLKSDLKNLMRRPRETIHSWLNFCCIVLTALMLWKALVLFARSPSPVVVVLSGSMEPAFQRGDILFLVNNEEKLRAGDIVVFKIDGRDIPIVHRILSYHEDFDPENTLLLTKGDNNNVDDRGLYADNQLWLKKKNVIGTTITYLPYVGLLTIILNDYPPVKWSAIGIMFFLAILGYE